MAWNEPDWEEIRRLENLNAELLEACKEALRLLDRLDRNGIYYKRACNAYDNLKQAVNKAEGK